MKRSSALLITALVATAANAQKEITICEDYVSDGGYSYRLEKSSERCSRAMKKAFDQQVTYIEEGWGKNLYQQYLAEQKVECAEYRALFSEGAPPKTIERKCETFIDNRGEQ